MQQVQMQIQNNDTVQVQIKQAYRYCCMPTRKLSYAHKDLCHP
jgi:hypothetical protein